MKLLGVTILAFAIAIANTEMVGRHDLSRHSATYLSLIGKTIKSEYKAYTVSGFPLLNNERTGIAIWSDVLSYYESDSKITVQLQKPVIRQVYLNPDSVLPVDRVPDVEVALNNEQEFRRLPQHIEDELTMFIEKEIYLTLKGGKVVDIVGDKDEPEWILNLKAGVFEQYNVPKMTHTTETTVEDTLVGEECEIDYDMMKFPENKSHVLITKKYSLDSCVRPLVRDDLLRYANEPRKDSRHEPYLRTSFVTIMNVTDADTSSPFIYNWVTEGRYTATAFTPSHGEAITYTRQEMRFAGYSDKKLPSLVSTKSKSLVSRRQSWTASIKSIKSSYTSHDEDLKLDLIKSLFTEIVQTIELSSKPTFDVDVSEKFTIAMKIMNTLNESSSFKQIADMATKDQNKPMRRMIISALSNTHVPAMWEALPSLESKLTLDELSTIVTGLGGNGYASPDSVRTLKKVYVDIKEPTLRRPTLLAIGSQIYQLCRPHRVYGKDSIRFDPTCTDSLRVEFVNMFTQEYKKADNESRLVILKAIGNSGLEMVSMLEPIIWNNSTSMELRVNAIYAMRRCHDSRKAMDTLLPVLRRWSSPVEMRIAAFNTLLEIEPTSEMLTSLVSHLNKEPSMQLGNYIYTYLNSLVNIPTVFGSTKNLTMAAQNLLPTVRRFDDSLWYSQNRQYFYERLGKNVFNYIETSFISTPHQALPRSVFMKFAQEYCGFYLNMFEFGFRIEGADTYAKELFEKFFASKSLDKYSIYTRSFVKDLSRIHKILNDDDIKMRPVEETKGHIFFKVLGNEIGVISFDDTSIAKLTDDLMDKVMNLGTTRFFDIMALTPSGIRAQSPMGVIIFSDNAWDSTTSFHTDDMISSTPNSLWSKKVTLRNLLRSRIVHGITMGPMETSLGSCEHLKTVLPHAWEVSLDSKTGKMALEVYWNVDDPMYKSSEPENYKLVEISQTPVYSFVSVNKDKKELTAVYKKVQLHPLLKLAEQKYHFDFTGHNLTTISHVDDNTMALPTSPNDGRHIITLGFYDNIVKPFGLKVEFEPISKLLSEDTKTTLTVSLNPRVKDSSKTLDIDVSMSEEKVDEKASIQHLELALTPRWMNNGTYNFYFQDQRIMGRRNPTLSWLDAGEEHEMERLYTLQYGWNEKFDKNGQDFVVAYKVGKSDLQKDFEREDVKLSESVCNTCESMVKDTGVWENIFCERCMVKRQTRSLSNYTMFINSKEVGSEYLYDILKYLDSGVAPYKSFIESHKQEPVTPRLINEFSDLLSECMSSIPKDDIRAFRRSEEVHPIYSTGNVTYEVHNEELRFLNVPLMPSERRLDNLPLDRLTDVYLQREGYETRGVCQLDANRMVRTMDGVIYTIPSDLKSCSPRILLKDCSTDKTFEVIESLSDKNQRVVTVRMGDRTVKIEQTKDGYKVTVDSKPLPMDKKTVNEYSFEEFRMDSISGVVLDIEGPNDKKAKSLTMHLEDLYTEIVLVGDYVKVKVPFWLKNKVCGLCGDFNTEKVADLKLPDGSATHDLAKFVNAYSSDKCDNSL